MRVKLAIMTGWMTRTALCIALLMSVAAPVRADEVSMGGPENVPPPLFETRFIKEGDPAATTSKCIGNPITPLCAVDTYIAGSFYKKDKLREIAYGERPPINKLITPPPYNPYFSCYQITGYWVYQQEDRIYETKKFLKPGDVAFMVRWGGAKQTVDGEPIAGECDLRPAVRPLQSFLLRSGPNGWYIYGDFHMADYIRDPDPFRLRK